MPQPLKTFRWLAVMLSDTAAFFREHKDAVDKMKQLGFEVKDAGELFVANRALCSGSEQRVVCCDQVFWQQWPIAFV